MNRNDNYSNSSDKDYFTSGGPVVAELEIKKSVFIADLTKVSEKTEALTFINQIKRKYYDAHHNCWAYIVDNPKSPNFIGMSDGGEPRGSASGPIINVLRQKKMGHVVVVVTRYFGGIKLGMGRLMRAYSQVTNIATKNTLLWNFCEQKTIRALVPYKFVDLFLHITNEVGARIDGAHYEQLAIFQLTLDESIYVDFVRRTRDKTRGQIKYL